MLKLRPGQREVAAYRKGYLAVPAVPGAGKTTVLAYLAANLIEEGHTGRGRILIVTYMNSAVSNFRSRIGDYLEERGLSRNRGYEVRTLHSLALNILKEKPEFLLINDEFNIIDPARRGLFIRRLVDEWIADNRKRFYKFFDYEPNHPGFQRALKRWQEEHFPALIKTMFAQFKFHALSREQVSKLRQRLNEDSYLAWALTIYEEYDRVMHRQGLLDFDDLIVQALNLLKRDRQLRERLQGKYSYVFEDEAQDSNPLQAEILALLAGEDGNLVRVGDSNQAIMGTFTSADPEVFREFTSWKEVEKRSILYSSRSTEDIINLANQLVKWTSNNHPMEECRRALEEKYIYPVESDDPYPNPVTDNYTIAVNIYNKSDEEIAGVAHLAARYIRENPENTAAILVPSNYVLDNIIAELENEGVSYESLSDEGDERLRTIEDFKRVLYCLAEPGRRENICGVLKEVLLVEYKEESLDFIDRLFEEYSPEEIIYPIGGEVRYQEYAGKIVPEELRSVFKPALERLSLWLDAGVKLPADELILLLAEQLKLKEEELAVAQNIALQVKAELSLHPHWKLHEIVDELPRLEDSFKQFARKIYERKGYEPKEGVITLTTYHKAKGLEWDTVYLTYLSSDNFPSSVDDKFRSDHYYLKDDYSNPVAIARATLEKLLYSSQQTDPRRKAKIEFINERLRLLYVGITRARENLLLTAHKRLIFDNGSGKEVNPALPLLALSEFITKEREKDV